MCYAPEKQDFSTITLNSTGEFQVVTKTGETRYYGLQTVDRVNDSNGSTAIWVLDQVVDGWGNYFDFRYNNGAANFTDSGIWVSEIDYTGSLGGSQGSPIQPFNTLTFQYEGRSDTRWTTLRFPADSPESAPEIDHISARSLLPYVRARNSSGQWCVCASDDTDTGSQ